MRARPCYLRTCAGFQGAADSARIMLADRLRLPMQFFILSFLTSCIVSLLVVRSANAHARISADRNLTGPQKFHARPVPRVGGVGIFMGLLIGIVWADAFKMPMTPTLWLLLLTAMPAFLSGLAEDL